MTIKQEITIASVPDRDEVMAELWCGDEQWGELSQDSGCLRLELYPKSNGEPWVFEFNEAVEFLMQAKNRLLGGSAEKTE